MLAIRNGRELCEAGKLNAEQRLFFEARPAEQLFDVETDPHEVHNIAGDPQHTAILAVMRARMRQIVQFLPDLSFYPEPFMVEQALADGAAFGQKHQVAIAMLVDLIDHQLSPYDTARKHIASALRSDNPWRRYWGLILCSTFGEEAAEFALQAKALQNDSELLVRVRAAEFLGIAKLGDPQPALRSVLSKSTSDVETLLTFNTVALLRDHYGYEFDIKPGDVNSKGGEVSRRLEYLGIAKPAPKKQAGKKQKKK